MTALLGTIKFNNVEGDDGTASGCGPASALYGQNAETVSTNVIDLSADAPDLSGVLPGHLLYCTGTPRFNVIASVNNTTKMVTCDDTFGTSGPLDWAIGGKRATLQGDATVFNTHAKSGFIYEIQYTGTPYELFTLALNLTVANTHVMGTGGMPEIRQTANTSCFTCNGAWTGAIENLKFSNSSGTKTNAYGINFATPSQRLSAYNCVFGDATNQLSIGFYISDGNCSLRNCKAIHCTGSGIRLTTIQGTSLINCLIDSNGSNGVTCEFNDTISNTLINCVITRNAGAGVRDPASAIGCVVANNGSHGFDWGSANSSAVGMLLCNNIVANNTGYGFNLTATQANDRISNYGRNAFFGNTAGEVLNINRYRADDITLTADPFVNAAAGDFNLNHTAGGGAVLRGVSIDL